MEKRGTAGELSGQGDGWEEAFSSPWTPYCILYFQNSIPMSAAGELMMVFELTCPWPSVKTGLEASLFLPGFGERL